MKRFFLLMLLAAVFGFKSTVSSPRMDEGMWLPMYVDRLNWTEIQQMGLLLTIDQLYDTANPSIHDAVVGLAAGSAPGGFFCTGEIVSDQGLMFTNHHCAYDIIQTHSTVENDYLTDGFWAMSFEEELPNPGITASFLVRMEDLTEMVTAELTDEMTPQERSAKVREIANPLVEEASEDGRYDAIVKDFYFGSEYYLLVYETFKDIRLVGAPPSSIGKYGGDTDNWMWPRHTGDFAMLRIYTAPDGSPAEYAEENIPLKPRHFLPISLEGVKKDDYAMVWGFPGGTDRYLTSHGIQFAIEQNNPAIVNALDIILEVWRYHMDSDDATRIKYASDYASLANGWKYYIGQTRGLKNLDVKTQKQEIEHEFTEWVNADAERKMRYGNVLETIAAGYQLMDGLITPFYYLRLPISRMDVTTLTQLTAPLDTLLADRRKYRLEIEINTEPLRDFGESFFADFDKPIERDLMIAMLSLMQNDLQPHHLPDIFETINGRYGGNVAQYVNDLFDNSIFTDRDRYMRFLNRPRQRHLSDDPLLVALNSMLAVAQNILSDIITGQDMVDQNMRLFVDGLRAMHPDRNFYPDANSTMRFTYGTIQDYYPADAVHYNYITHLFGKMEKEDPTNPEFYIDEKLKELYQSKDYGIYGENGKMILNFLSTNDITGGNSGSPVLNGKGELIGIAFDGNWEAMSGDIAFEPSVQRTISVDIRYVLFVIDKFAGAKHLIDEMTIVR